MSTSETTQLYEVQFFNDDAGLWEAHEKKFGNKKDALDFILSYSAGGGLSCRVVPCELGTTAPKEDTTTEKTTRHYELQIYDETKKTWETIGSRHEDLELAKQYCYQYSSNYTMSCRVLCKEKMGNVYSETVVYKKSLLM